MSMVSVEGGFGTSLLDQSAVDNGAELSRYVGELAPEDRVLLAQLYLGAGAPEAALTLAHSGAVDALGLRLCGARAQSALGESAAALSTVERVLELSPEHPIARFYKAQILTQRGDVAQAVGLLAELTATFPDFPGALPALARLVFPGPNYRELLAQVHAALRPSVYLEIGVEHGGTLCLATHSKLAIGVEPAQVPLRHPAPPGARLFRQTSDDFFAQHSRASLLGAAGVDLAFIDGMHKFEYVLRDFCHVERWSTPASIVILHDCLPAAPSAALRARRSRFWVGDCWKALECLRVYRPDLMLSTLPCYPSGLVVIRGLDPSSNRLWEVLPELERQYLDRPFPYAPGQWPAAYGVVENSLAGLGVALGLSSPGLPPR